MNIRSATLDRICSRSALNMYSQSGEETGTNLLYALQTPSFCFVLCSCAGRCVTETDLYFGRLKPGDGIEACTDCNFAPASKCFEFQSQ